MSETRPRIAILTGPTSVGKTELSLTVAEALGTEILSADSMAVYRRMECATAKPSAEQRARVPHHLIDLVDPTEPFTVEDYRRAAMAEVHRLTALGKLPLFVGGTRLYLFALTQPFLSGPAPNPEYRAGLRNLEVEALHDRLAEVDPATAAWVHRRDRKRIIRALEVYELSGRPISEIQAESRTNSGLCDPIWVALTRDREELYRRVNARVDQMVADGLVDEVRGFLSEGLHADTPSMQGHGYKEILRALTGEYSLEEGIRLLKQNTRHYVKYQLMWMRQLPTLTFVRADRAADEVAAEVLSLYRSGSPSPS